MPIDEIILPETKPETEWVRGRALQKVSPTYAHGRLQFSIIAAVQKWLDTNRRGRVSLEWRFRVTHPGEITRPLVPDVGYLSYETIAANAPRELVAIPLAAPTVAFDVLSPDDKRKDVEHKTETYLRAGTSAVVIVDPSRTRITVHDAGGSRDLHTGDVFIHDAMPGFTLDVSDLFERAAED
jgi:Uma2 family endonuclease